MIEIDDFPIMVTVKIKTEKDTACMHRLSHMFAHLAKFESKIHPDPPGLKRGVRSMNL